MHIVITGANGFVGSTLTRRLLSEPSPLEWTRLTLLDLDFTEVHDNPGIHYIKGNIAERAVLELAFEQPAQIVFHLASIPGGLAEKNYVLGRQINLDATLTILELLREQTHIARLVFASSIAVYGSPMPSHIDDATPLRPQLTYGAQKLIGEVLLEDFSRRGWVDGIALRLPGIVARPPQPSGLLSAFMSDIFWKLRDNEAFECPVSSEAVAWWMSVQCCVDNLIHAATLSSSQLSSSRRTLALPVLRLSILQIVDAICALYGEDRRLQISYQPNESLENNFGRYPTISTLMAEALGFRHDGDEYQLVQTVIGRKR